VLDLMTEDEIRGQLEALDATNAPVLAAHDANILAQQAAAATAGTEYNQSAADALAASNTAVVQHQQFIDTLGETIGAIEDATDLINAIGEVAPPTVPTGTADCAAADVTAALADQAAQVNGIVEQIKAALVAMDAAAQGLKTVAEQMQSQLATTGGNSESEKAASYATLDTPPFG
jgi:hypothetical protein